MIKKLKPKTKYKKRIKKYSLSKDKNKFHSKFERDCYELLISYIDKAKITLQKKYPRHNIYNKLEKKTCDFYLYLNLTLIVWLEVSTYNKPLTTYRTDQKRKIINYMYPTNTFLFVNSLKQLEDILIQAKSHHLL